MIFWMNKVSNNHIFIKIFILKINGLFIKILTEMHNKGKIIKQISSIFQVRDYKLK